MLKFPSPIFIALALSVAACSAADPITNKFDCHDVCQRYSDCFPALKYDVAACKDRCESAAASSDQKQAKLNDCHDCIGENSSCVSDITSCSGSCSAFVP